MLIGADLVYLIISSIKKIADTDYCIYARIIELCIGKKDAFFCENDIITANKDGKCDYQTKDWKCPFLARDDDCTCNKEKISLGFIHLKEQNIIKKVGERWMLVW